MSTIFLVSALILSHGVLLMEFSWQRRMREEWRINAERWRVKYEESRVKL